MIKTSICVAVVLMWGVGPAAAQKTKAPAAVEAAFHNAYPTARITAVSSEKENGALQYELETIDGAVHRDIVYLPNGTVVVVEETIEASAVPAPVLAALKARYPKATATKYEKLSKGAAVTYEMQLKGAGVAEAEIAPDGTFIHPAPVVRKK